MSEVNNPNNTWIDECLCWLSQGINLFLCIKGATADETVSSRIGKYKVENNGEVPFKWTWPIPLFYWTYHILHRIPVLNKHFINAIEIDEGMDNDRS